MRSTGGRNYIPKKVQAEKAAMGKGKGKASAEARKKAAENVAAEDGKGKGSAAWMASCASVEAEVEVKDWSERGARGARGAHGARSARSSKDSRAFSTERACAERGARRGARCAQTEERSVLRCAQTQERGAQRAERRQRSGATMPQGQVAPRYYTHFDSFTPTHSPYLGPVQSTPYLIINSHFGSKLLAARLPRTPPA